MTDATGGPRLGGRLASRRGRHLRLADYLVRGSLIPPLAVDYSQAALPALRRVDLNDSLGDCVIAAGDHLVGIWTGNGGATPWQPTRPQIVADYAAISGYVPGRPETDQGADERTAMDYWQSHGFADGTRLTAWCAVNAGDRSEVELAAWLFEGLLLGVELPDPWVTPAPISDGFMWDGGTPNPRQGHAFCSYGYGLAGLQVATWGLLGTLTWGALAALCVPSAGGELYALLSPDLVERASQRSPGGVDWPTLRADFETLNAPPPRGCAAGRAWRKLWR